jgi:hypothetical protein
MAKRGDGFITDKELKEMVKSFINRDEAYMQKIFDDNPGTRTWEEMLKRHPESMPGKWALGDYRNFNHYNDEEYVAVGYDCFVTMSKKSVNALTSIVNKVAGGIEPYTEKRKIEQRHVDLVCNIKTIVDCGAGIGATTAKLKQSFPNAKVYFHNLKNTMQWKFARHLFNELNLNIEMISDVSEIVEDEIDCISSLEFFEHFSEPLPIINSFLTFNPKIILDSSRFQQAAQGHFKFYKVNGVDIHHRKMPKIYKRYLSDNGYDYSYISSFQWNRYPTIYIRSDLS